MRFFDVIKALFPRSRAFELFINNAKRRLMEALAAIADAVHAAAAAVYLDLFPDSTRETEKWLKVFGLNPVDVPQTDEPPVRGLLASLWRMKTGGQSADYLESVLRCIASDARVFENAPVASPRAADRRVLAVNSIPTMRCGNRRARCNAFVCGPYGAFSPIVLQNGACAEYAIPNSPRWWETCFFVCADVIRDSRGRIVRTEPLIIHAKWRKLIELLILKVKPLHTTAVLCAVWWTARPPLPRTPRLPLYRYDDGGPIGSLFPSIADPPGTNPRRPRLQAGLYPSHNGCYFHENMHIWGRPGNDFADYYAASRFCACFCYGCGAIGCIWTRKLLALSLKK
jgi:hypothetical protein